MICGISVQLTIGDPEKVKPARGSIIEVTAPDKSGDMSITMRVLGGDTLTSWLRPAEARELADALEEMADKEEEG